jgi:hypothetical protein
MKIVFTNHSTSRLAERKLDKDLVVQAVEYPDKVIAGKKIGTLEYIKRLGASRVTAVIKENDRGEKIVLSCWIDPPVSGTSDDKKKKRYLRYQKASIGKRIVMDILSIFGL